MKRTRMRRVGVLAGLRSIVAVDRVDDSGGARRYGSRRQPDDQHQRPHQPQGIAEDTGWRRSASTAAPPLATRDGSHIPAALGTELLVDKHIRLDTTGLKTCTLGQIEARTPPQAMKACGDALIGKGTSSAQVQFPESAAFEAKGPLLAFNGPAERGRGLRGRGYNEQLYYVYANVPVPTALIAVGKVSRAGGKYGYRISISIPTIAGGAGSFKAPSSRSTAGGPTKAKSTHFSMPSARTGNSTRRSKSRSTTART